ncbi:hypothetical protein AMTR_s00067p00142790 [Amborella trichopoda]|uniref:Uncharacterized protein n=1 Tax=Amborella trichopoda TaxID=13333 RepID=U5DEN2_AMBTC|nr:hypothetical protein AMTR_s00067p00142790 [Amborella trichopoda]
MASTHLIKAGKAYRAIRDASSWHIEPSEVQVYGCPQQIYSTSKRYWRSASPITNESRASP